MNDARIKQKDHQITTYIQVRFITSQEVKQRKILLAVALNQSVKLVTDCWKMLFSVTGENTSKQLLLSIKTRRHAKTNQNDHPYELENFVSCVINN
ncbi:CLUMA_CG016685, isoform A [Clunio marinus]|uniref:CLUMA_CG016685, isoform A n=1 Tax=Clunio marinus TaxID=568069 RepID=A0A1J1IS44_9DIPT|nr:CLUMA_CG016685, isoform A [Clunio marinus]